MKSGQLAPHARSIRERVAAGERQDHIALEFGCSQQAISNIVRDLVYNQPTFDGPRCEPHDRICCDCGGKFRQHEYESVRFRPMVRCAECAERKWRGRRGRI